MGNCLSGCTTRPSQNGGETVISYAAGKIIQTTTKEPTAHHTDTEKNQSQDEKQAKEYSIVQKELEALQSQITHSQAVLASLKFTFLEASVIKKNLDKVHRTTQTLQDSQPKSLENVSSTNRDKDWINLTSSCPAIVHTANIAVQTEFVDVSKHQYVNDAEYFLPPIGSPLDLKGCKDQLRNPLEPLSGIDLDIYRSCRKLSVLPEEENAGDDSPPGSRLAPTKYPDHQSHSFESYLLPGEGSHSVFRQLSDPTTSRSTRRPLQVVTDTVTEPPRVQDSGLGSELRIPSPTFTTLQDTLTQLVTISYSSDPHLDPVITLRTPQPLSPETPYKTPPDVTPGSPIKNSSSDTSLSFQTPTEVSSPGNQSPIEKIPSVSLPNVENEKIFLESEKPLLSVLMDDRPSTKDVKQDGSGKSLCPEQTALSRVPSRRRLVRSLARIGSEMPIDVPSDPPSEPAKDKEAESTDSAKPETSDTEQKQEKLKDSNDVKDQLEKMEPNQNVFPSLSDTALRQLGLWLQSTSEENKEQRIPEDDVENKYTSLVLAFKTDKLTLTRRLELQNKLRDQAEINMTHEVETLRSSIQLLNTLCNDSEKSELFDKVKHQIENLYKSTLRVSSTAELFGAVQQENRLSKAVDIILRHVENLKQAYEKEKTEHEETRKLIKENKVPVIAAIKTNGKRRASIATLHQGQNSETSTSASDRRGSSSRRGSTLRKSVLTKHESQNDVLKLNNSEGDSLNKICEQLVDGVIHLESHSNEHLDSCTSHPNSSEQDTESENEISLKKKSLAREELEVKRKLPQRYKFRKRSSFCAPSWLIKMIGYLHWLEPYEDYALQARYFLAGLFVFAAICIVSSSFFISYKV